VGYSVPRQTAYALMSGIEEDLRDLADLHLSPWPVLDVLGPDLFSKASARLKDEAGSANTEPALRTFLSYLDFGETVHVLNTNRARLPGPVGAWLRKQTVTFEALMPVRNRVMHFRPLNFNDLALVESACGQFIASGQGSWSHLRDVQDRLKANPAFVVGLEIPVRRGVERHNLPLPEFDDTGFLGRQEVVTDLTNRCLAAPTQSSQFRHRRTRQDVVGAQSCLRHS